MSEMQTSGVAASAGGFSSQSTPRVEATASADLMSDSTQSAQVSASTSSSRTMNLSSSSSSSSSLFVQQNSRDDKLAMLVMLLAQFLLGKNDEDQDKDNPLKALAGLMMLSSMNQTQSRFGYFEQQSSSVSLSISESSTTSYQATAQSSSGAAGAAGSLGGEIDVKG